MRYHQAGVLFQYVFMYSGSISSLKIIFLSIMDFFLATKHINVSLLVLFERGFPKTFHESSEISVYSHSTDLIVSCSFVI